MILSHQYQYDAIVRVRSEVPPSVIDVSQVRMLSYQTRSYSKNIVHQYLFSYTYIIITMIFVL